mmetsp:Transcript_148250/g.412881  ORF Transcript_148250/g.412881 Transcript_148250/m.412881 type:complete len:386 (-) Transcript_148250:1096-2253(-)
MHEARAFPGHTSHTRSVIILLRAFKSDASGRLPSVVIVILLFFILGWRQLLQAHEAGTLPRHAPGLLPSLVVLVLVLVIGGRQLIQVHEAGAFPGRTSCARSLATLLRALKSDTSVLWPSVITVVLLFLVVGGRQLIHMHKACAFPRHASDAGSGVTLLGPLKPDASWLISSLLVVLLILVVRGRQLIQVHEAGALPDRASYARSLITLLCTLEPDAYGRSPHELLLLIVILILGLVVIRRRQLGSVHKARALPHQATFAISTAMCVQDSHMTSLSLWAIVGAALLILVVGRRQLGCAHEARAFPDERFHVVSVSGQDSNLPPGLCTWRFLLFFLLLLVRGRQLERANKASTFPGELVRGVIPKALLESDPIFSPVAPCLVVLLI